MAEAKWYAIQTYSGHENKVQRLVQRRIEEEPGEPEEKQIQDVLVPTQEVVELRNGKRVTVTRRLYPGYVLVKMNYNQRTGHLINSIQGVIKFLGTGSEPQPLHEEDLNKIFGGAPTEDEPAEEPIEQIPFTVGQVVLVETVVHDRDVGQTGTSVQQAPTAVGGRCRTRVGLGSFGNHTTVRVNPAHVLVEVQERVHVEHPVQ